jgi:ATP-binding cassette subfamily B protein
VSTEVQRSRERTNSGTSRDRPVVPLRDRLRDVASLIAAAPRRAVLGDMALALAGGALPIGLAWLTKLVLDQAQAHSPAAVRSGALLLATAAAVAVVPFGERYLGGLVSRAVSAAAQDRLYQTVNRFVGLARFEDPSFLDRLRVAAQAGQDTPGRLLGAAINMSRAGILMVGFVASLLVTAPLLAVVVVAAGTPAVLAELSLSRRRAALSLATAPASRRRGLYSNLLTDSRAVKEVRLLGLGGFLRQRLRDDLADTHRATHDLDRADALVGGILALLGTAATGFGLLWAINEAAKGELSSGDVLVFVAAIVGTRTGLAQFVSAAGQARESLLTFDHYAAIQRAGPDLPVAERPRPLPLLKHGIEFRDVWFRYGPDRPWVLRGLNLVIPYGHAVGLVGRNGAGKSTVVKLLCRFYDPDRGAVHWDGIDLRELSVTELRARIGAVFQDYMTYDLTAAENIGVGDLSALETQERIEAAARRAGIHETIARLPNGYATSLTRTLFLPPPETRQSGTGQPSAGKSSAGKPGTGRSSAGQADVTGGVNLSGGQWQRIALARAYLRQDRDLLILDEPSAGLDAEAEHEVHSGLRMHRAGRTSLLISHRLGTLRDCDQIAVIDDGQVVESGNHVQLLSTDGTYARLFNVQAEGYRPAEAS